MILFKDESIMVRDDDNFRYLHLFGNFNEHAYQALSLKADFKRVFGYEKTIIDLIKGVEASNILVIGCGSGSVIRSIRDKFFNASIVGVDVVCQLPEICKSYFGGFPLDEFCCGDARGQLQEFSPCSFDLVILDVYGEEVNKYSQCIEFGTELLRVIKTGGCLIQHFYCVPHIKGASERIIEYCTTLENIFSKVETHGEYNSKFEGIIFTAIK